MDIIYEISMPVIVKKKEVHADDDDKDCEILSVQPAPLGLLKNIKVKEEKLEDDIPKQAHTEKKTSHEHKTGEQPDEKMADEEEGTPKKRNKSGLKKATESLPKQRNLRSSSKKKKLSGPRQLN